MKYIHTFLFVAISATCFAQGNLQFNKVLNFDYAATVINNPYRIGSVIVDILIVPVGKVWKITTASCKDIDETKRNTSIAINNHFLYEVRGTSTSAFHVSNNTPYWLSSGTINEVKIFNDYVTSSVNNTISAVGAISVIEFNIIP